MWEGSAAGFGVLVASVTGVRAVGSGRDVMAVTGVAVAGVGFAIAAHSLTLTQNEPAVKAVTAGNTKRTGTEVSVGGK
jgi:hypothetical protein